LPELFHRISDISSFKKILNYHFLNYELLKFTNDIFRHKIDLFTSLIWFKIVADI